MNPFTRRDFIATVGSATTAAILSPLSSMGSIAKKKRLAIVGTGIRALDMWSKDVAKSYTELVEFVGLCDINPGRVAYFKANTGFTCPTFTDFEKMMKEVKPDMLIVTTVDATHHEFIYSWDGVGSRHHY